MTIKLLSVPERRPYSLINTIGAACILSLVVLLVTGVSLDRSQLAMERFLAEKGEALIAALESGVRSGVRSRAGIRLQFLVEELADRPDVRFIAVTMPDGTILAHSKLARVGGVLTMAGGQPVRPEALSSLAISQHPTWNIMDLEGGTSFVVYKLFHPQFRQADRKKHPIPPEPDHPEQSPYIFLGLDVSPLEIAQTQNLQRALVLSGSLLLAGILALMGLHGLERLRASRRGQRIAEAIAEKLAVTLPDGLILLDAKARIVRLNAAALRLLHLPAPCDSYSGKKPADILPTEITDLIVQLLDSATLGDTELRLRNGDKIGYLSVRGGHVCDSDGERLGSLLFLRDMSEVRRLEAKVRRREKLAAVGNLAAGVAHELRNPLSSIKGYATYLGGRFPAGSPDREAAEIMVREVERLNRSIGDLIGLSRPTDIHPKPTDFRSLVEDTLRLIRQDAVGRGVIVCLNASPSLPSAFVDPDRMRQVLLNLCLNALEAMPRGGNLTLSVNTENGDLILEVLDSGTGIAPQALAHIFDPYYTTKGQGTGLGLATVHKIVEAHGGTISVISEQGIGSLFKIVLPSDEKRFGMPG